MIIKKEKDIWYVHCCICNAWLELNANTYRVDDPNGKDEYDRIRCLIDDDDNGWGHLLGYRKDLPDELV